MRYGVGMPITTGADAAGRFAILTITDPYDMDEWRSALVRVFDVPVFRERRLILIDRRNCSPASSAYVSEMTQFFGAHREAISGARGAIVVSDDTSFGVGRMTALQTELQNPDVTIRTFRTYDDAERWLVFG